MSVLDRPGTIPAQRSEAPAERSCAEGATAPLLAPSVAADLPGWGEYGETRYSLSTADVSRDEWELYADIVVGRMDNHGRGVTFRQWLRSLVVAR